MNESLLARECERPRSLASVQMARLDWSTQNNAAISLKVLAELVRSGSVPLPDVSDVGGELIIGVKRT